MREIHPYLPLQGACPYFPREEALENIADAIRLWLEVEAEENGIKSVEMTEIAL